MRVALALILGSVVLGCSRGEQTSAANAGPLHVLLIGVDGADPDILDRLIAAGRLPNFARLKREGAWGRLRSIEPLLSPLVWTTIVTGRKAHEHGVLDFVEFDEKGALTPVSSASRRVPALWNVLTEFGRSSGFIGWYASYPAEATKGFVVSDRLAFHQVRTARAAQGATHPESLVAELLNAVGEPVPDSRAAEGRFVSGLAPATGDARHRLDELAKHQATADFYQRAASELVRRFRPEVVGVYFELVDACSHLFMEDAPPPRAGLSGEVLAAFGDTVDRCYVYQDQILGDLLRLEGPETTTLLVSDHGFKWGDLRPRTSGRADIGLAPLWHRVHGVVALHGAGVKASRVVEGASILDVLPTIMTRLGLPLSKELPGHPLDGAFEPSAMPRRREILAYASPPPRARPLGAPLDQEAVERLRALGYLGGAASPPPGTGETRTAASYVSEGVALEGDGQRSAALRAYTRATELDPKNPEARVHQARLLILDGRLKEAATALREALAVQPGNPAVRIQRAHLALRSGQLAEAGRELEQAARLDDRLPYLHLMRSRLAHLAGRTDEALAALDKAARLTDSPAMLTEIGLYRARVAAESGRPDEAEAALRSLREQLPDEGLAAVRGAIALARGRFAEAAGLLLVAAERNPGDVAVGRQLGHALAGSGDVRGAEAAFRGAVSTARSDPDLEGAYSDLARLLQSQGRVDQALSVLREATRAVPRSPGLWGMLGASHGQRGDYPQAIAAYERSVTLGATALTCKTLAALLMQVRGDRARAVVLWNQSLGLEPNQPEVRAFLKQYEQ